MMYTKAHEELATVMRVIRERRAFYDLWVEKLIDYADKQPPAQQEALLMFARQILEDCK